YPRCHLPSQPCSSSCGTLDRPSILAHKRDFPTILFPTLTLVIFSANLLASVLLHYPHHSPP
ncbi:methylmalonate-semialdehyde dehydrogenase, partial [Moniliophthora roreri]